MATADLLKRAQFCALFFLLQSCCKQATWELDQAAANCPAYHSTRLHSRRAQACTGLELEIVRSCIGERVYLNLHGCTLSCEGNTTIQVSMEGQHFAVDASVFEGGQRLLLADEGAQAIIQALSNCHPVTLKVGPYSREFLPDNFSELYADSQLAL